MNARPYRCPLGDLQPEPMDVERVKREGWHSDRILVVREDDDRLDFVEREFIKRIGERLYGKGRRHG